MRRIVLVLSALVVLTLGGGVLPSDARAQEPPEGVRVRGEGLVVAAPDIATLSIGASVRRETPVLAFRRAEELAEALVQMFTAQGVAATDIQTVNVSLNPEFGPAPVPPGPPQPVAASSVIVGWRATHLFSVKLRDFSRIPTVLEAAVTLLGSDAQIQGIFFGVEDTDALISRARAEAFQNAREAAEELARLAGMRLGEVLSIDEQFTPSPTPVQLAPGVASSIPASLATPAPQRSGDASGPFSPGQVSVRVFVTVVFALVPARS